MKEIPAGLREAKRWILWRHLSGRKPPCDSTGAPLRQWNDPTGWFTFEDAQTALARNPALSGAGFVIGDGYAGLDLDHCRDVATGELAGAAEAVLALCPRAYSEVSPSGEGVKVFGLGNGWLELTFGPGGIRRVERKPSGYFTVTGQVLQAGGLEELPLDLIERSFASTAGAAPPTAARPRTAALPPPGSDVLPGGQDAWLRNRAWRHACRGMQYEDILAQLRVDVTRCPPSGAPWTEADLARHAASAVKKVGERASLGDAFETDDTGNAEFMAATFGDRIRYDHRLARWLIFDGHRWKPESDGEVCRTAVESARLRIAAALKISEDTIRTARLKALTYVTARRKLEDTIALASKFHPITDAGTNWDSRLDLLGVQNGVVDLRTGELREGRPEDRITMQAAYPYLPEAPCPLWEDTLAGIFQDNPKVVPYVQRALGYSITGYCREEVFFLLTGTGRNGKGTIINTVAKVLGDYAAEIPFASIEVSKHGESASAASPELAKLYHKRFVTSSETSGSRLNTGTIKKLTGRDPIPARHLYKESFTFDPEFKLWLSVNALPRVAEDDAFWSRPHRVPFLQTYLGREDLGLKDRLLLEGPGILAWLVRGALHWIGEGLKPPAVVTEAVKDYQTSQEPLADFYEDLCVIHPEAHEMVGRLFGAYMGWAKEQHRRFIIGRKRFSQEIAKRVGPAVENRAGFQFQGIGLKAPEDQGPAPF